MTRPLDIEKLIRIPSLLDYYDLAPDGQTAAVVWDRSGQWEIYLAPLSGQTLPRQITAGPHSKWAPRFSPDGQRLVYAQDYAGDENFDLFLYDRRTGQSRNLTPDTPNETINPEVSWSPDGKQIAFVSSREGRFATYALEVDQPGFVRRLTRHTHTDLNVEWSPDGRHVAVTSLTKGQETWVFVVPAEGGEARPISGPGGAVDASQPRWSPDGKQIVFISNSPGIGCVCTYSLSVGVVIRETPPSHEAAQPAWSPDGRRLAFTWNEDGNLCLAVKDLTTHSVRHYRPAAGEHMAPRFTPDGRALVHLFSGPRHPNDLWLLDLKSGRRRQLTRSLPRPFTGREFMEPTVVRWTSDHLTVAGLLYKPRGFRRGRAPGVVYVHGGPTWQHTNRWAPAVQHLVSAGFVVLAPNYRGSTGYGRAFQEANRFDLGGGDMRDVIAGAEFLVRQGYAAPGRLAITGSSYGGYLTMTALTKHPAIFAAGSALVPFLNWFTEHANERADLQHWDEQNFGDPVKNADRYREYSPHFFLSNIIAPVQMIAGAHDPRCPASETEQAAAVLKELNVPHEVIIYPDEGHGFRKVDNRVDAYRRRASFLLEHLGLRRARPARAARKAPAKTKAKTRARPAPAARKAPASAKAKVRTPARARPKPAARTRPKTTRRR